MEKVRLGIFGAGRGMTLASAMMFIDSVQVVAICDNHKERLEAAMKRLDSTVSAYEDFDEFVQHPMDAVILANNFYQHAPYAIKCFEKNLHVLSECITNATMGEGVALVRAFEKSKSIYMLAENYPHMLFNREMKSVADGGTLGKILYAEGEYNHPVSDWDTSFTKRYRFYPEHWRHYIPATYYITHSLGPVMHITGATSKKVTAFPMYVPTEEEIPTATHNADKVANITTLNDDGSVFRVTGWAQCGAHHNSYRICGTKGQIENVRGMDGRVMLRYNEWDIPEGADCEKLYKPLWNDKDEEFIKKSEHEGADFVMGRLFVECVLAGKQPPHPFDLYSATVMSSVALLGHRSVMDGGEPYDIPDFRKEEDRKLYEDDFLTPFFGDDGSAPTLPCCSNLNYKPTEKQMELYMKELEK